MLPNGSVPVPASGMQGHTMKTPSSYKDTALHFANSFMYEAAQVYATLALVEAVRNLNKPDGSAVINTTAVPVNISI